MAQFFVIWLYLQKAMYRPCDLDLWPMKVNIFQWIEYNPISILYKFQIDISSNSREIKYQNIGRTHRYTHTQTDTHTHRQTGWKQYLATPSGGEVIRSDFGYLNTEIDKIRYFVVYLDKKKPTKTPRLNTKWLLTWFLEVALTSDHINNIKIRFHDP